MRAVLVDFVAAVSFCALCLFASSEGVAQSGWPSSPSTPLPTPRSGSPVPSLPPLLQASPMLRTQPLPDTDFVWTWGELGSADDDERQARKRDDDVLVVHLEGRQGNHACELLAELTDVEPRSQRVRSFETLLEVASNRQDFASRLKALLDSPRSAAVVSGARLSCVVSPSEQEQRALERARKAQERRRSR